VAAELISAGMKAALAAAGVGERLLVHSKGGMKRGKRERGVRARATEGET